MKTSKSNLVLIGMPGSGKSTVGILLAKKTSLDFIDTDVVIQSMAHRSLQDIIDKEGYMSLREIEEKAILSLKVNDTVIATGGSVVYSEKSMAHLSRNSTIIFLNLSLDSLRNRINDYDERGIARRPDQSFEDLFQERSILYHKHAEVIIDCEGKSQEAVCSAILQSL